MKFTVEKSSDWNYDGTVELETVPALLKWIEANGGAVVIDLKDDTRGLDDRDIRLLPRMT